MKTYFASTVGRKILNLRGHPYQLIHNVAKKSERNTFFVNRIVGSGDNLHLDACVFSSFKQFKLSLTTDAFLLSVKLSLNRLDFIALSLHSFLIFIMFYSSFYSF